MNMTQLKNVTHLRETVIPSDTCEILPVTRSWRDRLRKQAYDNAVTLFFLALCFFITWVLMILLSVGVLP